MAPLLLDSLATEVVRVRIDFTQYAEAYYFHDGEDHSSLAATVGYAATLAQRGQAAQRPEVRLAGEVLAGALKDLALSLFVGMAAGIYSSVFIATPLLVQLKELEPGVRAGDTATEVFAAYAADHGRSLAQP